MTQRSASGNEKYPTFAKALLLPGSWAGTLPRFPDYPPGTPPGPRDYPPETPLLRHGDANASQEKCPGVTSFTPLLRVGSRP